VDGRSPLENERRCDFLPPLVSKREEGCEMALSDFIQLQILITSVAVLFYTIGYHTGHKK
jgi:hypothetical protein